MNFFLIIDKPKGPTSHDIVQSVRNVLKRGVGEVKVGHAGTLDPLATGVLPIAIGRATKQIDSIMDGPKVYEATLTLGIKTASGDLGEPVLEERTPRSHSSEEMEAALQKFKGELIQKTPVYSAVRWKGKRLYDLVRRGKTVPEIPRCISIHELKLLKREENSLYLSITCSKGTYIRQLLPDIAEALGELGCVTHLRRVQTGVFTIAQSAPWEAVEEGLRGLLDGPEKHGDLDFTRVPGYASLPALCHT